MASNVPSSSCLDGVFDDAAGLGVVVVVGRDNGGGIGSAVVAEEEVGEAVAA